MKERSQIDAMRAAVRGDIERSRARQQGSPIVQPDDDRVEDRIQPVPETDSGPEPKLVEPEPVEPEPVEPELVEPELVEPELVEPETEPVEAEPVAPEPVARKPWSSIFSSLFKRR
jgi:hypothetical protein